MLKNLFVISSFLVTMLVISTNHSIAGRHFSKDEKQDGDLSLAEAKSKYANAPNMGKQLEAYEDLCRFEPDGIEEIGKELINTLSLLPYLETRKIAVALCARALNAKENCRFEELKRFSNVLFRLLSLKNQENLVNDYNDSLNNGDIKKIQSFSIELLELLKDVPEASDLIFDFSYSNLCKIKQKVGLFYLRDLVENKGLRLPLILAGYLREMQSSGLAIPFPSETVFSFYKAIFDDERFKFNCIYISEYLPLCFSNGHESDAKDLLLEVLENGDTHAGFTNAFRYALAMSYSQLNDHDKAISIFQALISLNTDEIDKKDCTLRLIHHLYELGNSEKGREVIQEMAQPSLSHLSDQRDNRKATQRKRYVEGIKYALAQKEKEETAVKESSGKHEKRKKPSPAIVSTEIGDSFLPEALRKSSQSEPPSRVKRKTRKQADPALNRKRDPEKFQKKGEKEEILIKKGVQCRTAEELPNGPYATLVEIFRIFVGEVRFGACEIMVEKVGHLFESLGHTYSKARGHGGHSMILCNEGEKEEGAQRKAFTFGSKKKLNPSAIVDIASFLLEYRIYPEQFEEKLKDLL